MNKLEILLNWYALDKFFHPGIEEHPINKILNHYNCKNYEELFQLFLKGKIIFFKLCTDNFNYWLNFCNDLYIINQSIDNKFIENAIKFLEKKNIFEYKRLPWCSSSKISELTYFLNKELDTLGLYKL